MFIKLVANSSASNDYSAWNDVTLTIKNLLDGTYTSTSDLSTTYWNTAACSIQGLYPQQSGSLNTFTSLSRNSSTSNTSDSYLQFDFNHADRTASYPYHCRVYLYFTATGTYGFRARTSDGANTNLVPMNSTSYYSMTSSSNNKYTCNFPQETILIWANKHAFVIQMYNGTRMSTHGVFGYDASAGNQYQYDVLGSSAHAPFISMGSHMVVSRWNSGTYDNSTNDRFWIMANTYKAPDQSNESFTTIAGTDYHTGYSVGLGSAYMYMQPDIWSNCYPLRTSTGHTHQLIPQYVTGHHNSEATGYPFTGRLKTLYRTSDDIAPPGTIITYDNTDYAVFMPYKCGASSGNTNNTQNLCFLIPTTVDGR